MKIVFLDKKTIGDDINLEEFKKFGDVIEYGYTMADETLSRVQDATIVVTNKVVIDKNIMDNSDIKLICIAATGMNNVDLEYAKEKNIIVKNVAGYSTASVAQLTLSYVLHFISHLNHYDKYCKDGSWAQSKIFTNLDKPFFELDGKKWGIIALGEIGRKVAQIASAFGCEVSYFSTSGANKNPDYKQVELNELLSQSDIVTIHAPLNEKTLNLINKENLPLLKEKAILVNVGRGGIVNEDDIVEELNKREIYFATDVLAKEPMSKESILFDVKDKTQILMTPHIAWASYESRQRLVKGIIKNIEDFL